MLRAVVALVVVMEALPFPVSCAQAPGRTVTLTVSPSFVSFDPFGSFPAAVAQLGARRDFNRNFGGELSVFALGTLGGATAVPDCPAGVPCETRSTPGAFTGLLASLLASAGTSGLRATLGVGAVTASGGEGLENRSSAAASVGAEWVLRTTNRWAPTVGVRFVQLASPIAGTRQLLLPGIGLAF